MNKSKGILSGLTLGLALLFLLAARSGMGATLPYAEGGPAVDDPGARLPANLRRYVDASAGNDGRDGKSPANAWKSLSKVAAERGTFAPGAHVLFKRGDTWTGDLEFDEVHGTAGNRIVLGAYGTPLSARPKVLGNVRVSIASYLMVRDFDCIRIPANDGAHHLVIFDNVVHGSPEINMWPNNGILAFGKSHHLAIVQNLVYDLGSNDCIVLHPNSAKIGVRDGHWIADNICIGNAGMEDGIDLAMSEPAYGTDPVIAQDVKVVGNFIQMKALAGLSTKTGRGAKCVGAGHKGKYLWLVANTMGGSDHIGLNTLVDKQYVQVSGNVVFNCANNNRKVSCELHPRELRTEHNTFIHTMQNREPVKIAGTNHRFTHNLLIRVQTPGNWASVQPDPPSSALSQMDWNWYGYSISPTVDGMSLAQWRTMSGFDANSSAGPVPGVTVPQTGSSNNDPRNWSDEAFLGNFIPESSWAGCAGADTPGAFDCGGKRLGMTLRPFPGLKENGGYGWEGPLIIQQRYGKTTGRD